MDNETMQKRLGTGLGSGLGGAVVAAAEPTHIPTPESGRKDAATEEEEL